MKRYFTFLSCLFILPLSGYSQDFLKPALKQQAVGYDNIIPRTWSIIMADSADFNDDHFEDYVFIIEPDKDFLNTNNFNTKLNAPPRVLIILFGGLNDTVNLVMRADSAVMLAHSGEGDPLSQGTGMKTDGNIFEINYSGGLTVQWTAQYKFAYKNNSWNMSYYKGTEYNTSDEESPIKVYEIDFNKKFLKQDKVKTPMPNLPKIPLEKFKPKTTEIISGLVI